MTIDKTIAAAQPADPDGDWSDFFRAITRPEPAPATACRTCGDRGFYRFAPDAYRHCQCPAGESLRSGVMQRDR